MQLLLEQFVAPIAPSDVERCMKQWCHEVDPAAPLHKTLLLNEMHVMGMRLCCEMHRSDFAGYDQYDLQTTIAPLLPLPFPQTLLSRLRWSELLDLMATLQLGYKKLLVWDDADGYSTYFDYRLFILFLMKRMGYWIGHEWRDGDAGAVPDLAAAQGTEQVDAEGWRRLAPTTVAHLLDNVHTFAALTNRLLSATVVAVANAHTQLELQSHHRESSLDEFYVNAMVSDVPVGSILQYAHRFQYLFHSITQVVYFHWPSYRRVNQLSLEQLRAPDTPPQNLLPLLLQIDPAPPVLNEHTQALCHTLRNVPWAWMNVAGYFALMHSDGAVYVAKDIRELFLFKQAQIAAARPPPI